MPIRPAASSRVSVRVIHHFSSIAIPATSLVRRSMPETSADVYSLLINNILPVGLRGLVAAALLAALMSTVSGALNSIATLFTLDIYKRRRPQASEKRLTLVGRLVTLAGMIAAILWSPFVSHFQSLFQGITAVICYIAPPITAVFIWGVLWRKASAAAAKVTLMAGSGLGLAVFLLDWFKDVTGWRVPSMMATFYLFLICSAILVGVSLRRPHVHTEESARLVWPHPVAAVKGPWGPGWIDYRLVALVLFLAMAGLYVVFR